MQIANRVKHFFKKHLSDRLFLHQLQQSHPEAVDIIKYVKNNNLTYLDNEALFGLYQAVQQVENKKIDGILIEAGCALGGSAIVMTAAKASTRSLVIYDTFGTIPPPSENDETDSKDRYEKIIKGEAKGLGGDAYYGYLPDLLKKVKESFSSANYPPEENALVFIEGLYESTLHPQEPVALAHIDCDWFDSVMVCLERITPFLPQGGILVIDDYYHWSGCKKAVDEFFKDRFHEFDFIHGSRLQIQKK